tara:strand:+ start:153 stop:989 length:837 start_codon:yes stop_codon:yes gene_type:complete
LLFIQENRPDIIDTSFLIGNDKLIKDLSAGYDSQALRHEPRNQRHQEKITTGLNELNIADAALNKEVPETTTPSYNDGSTTPHPVGVDFDKPVSDITPKRDLNTEGNNARISTSNEGESDQSQVKNKTTPNQAVHSEPSSIDEQKALKALSSIREVEFNNIKESCINQIQRYITSRGDVNLEGDFSPSFRTRWFRDTELTLKKVGKMDELKQEIQKAESFDDISKAITNLIEDPIAVKADYFSSGVKRCLTQCLSSVQLGMQREEPSEQDKDSPRITN